MATQYDLLIINSINYSSIVENYNIQMFRSRNEENPSKQLLNRYFARSITPLQKTIRSVSNVAGSVVTAIQKPFSYLTSIIRSRSKREEPERTANSPPKETKAMKMQEKRKKKKFCDFNADHEDSQQEPNNSAVKSSESMEMNRKADSSSMEASSLSRRQNFSSYLVEIPPYVRQTRKRLKKENQSEDNIRWRIYTQKTRQEFKEWSKKVKEESEKEAERIREEASPESASRRFRKSMKVPRERPQLDSKQYKDFVEEKLPKLFDIDKAIKFLVDKENEHNKKVEEERKQKQMEESKPEIEKVQVEEKKLLPNPFSSEGMFSQVKTTTNSNEPSKFSFGLPQSKPLFGSNSGSSQIFGGFNLHSQQTLDKKVEEQPENVEKTTPPPVFMFSNINKKDSQKSIQISLGKIPQKNDEEKAKIFEKEKIQEKEKNEEKGDNQGNEEKVQITSLEKIESKEEKKPEEKKMPEISLFSKKKSSQNKDQSQKKSEIIENPFLSKSPAKGIGLNEILSGNKSEQKSSEQPKMPFFSTPNHSNVFANNENQKPNISEEDGMEIQADQMRKSDHQPTQIFGNPQPFFSSPSTNQQQPQGFFNSNPTFLSQNNAFSQKNYNPEQAKMMFQQSPGQSNSHGLFEGGRKDTGQGSNNQKRKKDRSVRAYN